MQANKQDPINTKLESLIGNLYLYRGRQVRVKGSVISDEQIRIQNGGNTIIFPVEKLDEELKNFMPMDEPSSLALEEQRDSVEKQAVAIFQKESGQMNSLEQVIMHNIEKLQADKDYLPQAQAINEQVKTMLEMTKTKLKMHQEIRKAQKLST